jgi:hypothetical protein
VQSLHAVKSVEPNARECHSVAHVEGVRRRPEPSGGAKGECHAGPCADPAPGFHPIELVVDGEKFLVTRRADSSGTYDFAWISHPASYGFSIGTNADWHPDRAELVKQIRSFLTDIDPKTGYLRD